MLNIRPHTYDILDQRQDAKLLDLRNRVITPDGWTPETNLPQPEQRQYSADRPVDVPAGPTCKIDGCDSILTVSDWGGVCRQCQMERKA